MYVCMRVSIFIKNSLQQKKFVSFFLPQQIFQLTVIAVHVKIRNRQQNKIQQENFCKTTTN